MSHFWSENKKKIRHAGNWIVSALWIWVLLSFWSCVPLIKFPISNFEVSFFLILGIQILLCCNVKEMLLLRDREWNYVIAILVLTVICLFFADSRSGAFFTVCNFCLLLYVSERWDWKLGPQCLALCGCLGVYFQWLFWPFLTTTKRNPNTAGTVIVFLTFTMFVFIERWIQKKWLRVFLQVILLLVAFYQLWIYHGRSTAGALLFFCIMKYLMPVVSWQKEKYYRFAFGILTIGSILFAILYTAAWQIFDPEREVHIFGKRLFSGREAIWLEVLQHFAKQPLWGAGTNYTIQSFYEVNVHNAMLDILVIHGVIVFVLVIAYIWWKMKRIYHKHPKNALFITAMSGVMAIFWESVTDMDLLWTPEFMIWSLMLMILNSDPDKIQEREE